MNRTIPRAVTRAVARAGRIARVLLETQYAYMLEYRAEIALWVLSGVLPLIMLGVWSGSGASQAAGLSPVQLSRYFLAAFLVRQFTVVWMIHVFEEDVLQGKLSPFLLQPLLPLWRYLAAHLAEQATRLPFLLVLLPPLALIAPGSLWLPPPSRLLLGVLAIVAVFLLRFLIQTMVAMACFWTERAAALDRLLMIPYLFLSGLVAPLDTFPPAMRRLAEATPFPWMVDFPARLLAGAAVDVGQGFGAIGAWCLLVLPIAGWLWRRGLRRYGAMGA
jgi:ABC-2 type transport system permease protein